MKRFAANALLVLGSLLIALLLSEGMSRLLMPLEFGNVTPRVEKTADGGRIRYATTREYNKSYGETPDGYRAPADADPETVFVGDSFTYGIGLNDAETIPALYCKAQDLRCVNLGLAGSGTGFQVARLRRFLEETDARPAEVKLLMLAMTDYLGSGNDLLDNLLYAEAGPPEFPSNADKDVAGAAVNEATSPQDPIGATTLAERLLDARSFFLEHSNLARVIYFQLGPLLRTTFSPAPERQRLERALRLTGEYLDELDALARSHGFDYDVVVIHPMQDLINGSDSNTLAALAPLVPNGRIIGTGAAFANDPRDYYYAYDGHLNPRGAAAVAQYLAEQAGRP